MGQVGWDEQRHILVLTGLAPAVPARTVLRRAKDWGLPAMAAERVSLATLIDQRISLNGNAGARVIARRLPGQPPIIWLIILDHRLDPANPEVRAVLESALTELRAVTGVGAVLARHPGLPTVVRSRPWCNQEQAPGVVSGCGELWVLTTASSWTLRFPA